MDKINLDFGKLSKNFGKLSKNFGKFYEEKPPTKSLNFRQNSPIEY